MLYVLMWAWKCWASPIANHYKTVKSSMSIILEIFLKTVKAPLLKPVVIGPVQHFSTGWKNGLEFPQSQSLNSPPFTPLRTWVVGKARPSRTWFQPRGLGSLDRVGTPCFFSPSASSHPHSKLCPPASLLLCALMLCRCLQNHTSKI